MSWIWIGLGSGAGLLTLWYLIRLVRRAKERDEIKRVNDQLNKDVDELVKAYHRQEKVESDHEMRISEIIHNHGLSIERINTLLQSWPGETPPPGPPSASAP